MKDDLISRSALIKEFERLGYTIKVTGIIDNAPTVYPICGDKACKYRANEKPQGKWIGVVYSNNRIGVGMCNQCGVNRIVDNFCPNCGAQMFKEVQNE